MRVITFRKGKQVRPPFSGFLSEHRNDLASLLGIAGPISDAGSSQRSFNKHQVQYWFFQGFYEPFHNRHFGRFFLRAERIFHNFCVLEPSFRSLS